MALTKEDLQAIGELMDQKLDQKLAPIQADIAGMKTEMAEMKTDIAGMKDDIEELKESMEEVRGSTNYLAEWVEGLETAFKRHEITGKG